MRPERPPLSSVQAVRDELRGLGYLDSGLARFVLAGAGAASPTLPLRAPRCEWAWPAGCWSVPR